MRQPHAVEGLEDCLRHHADASDMALGRLRSKVGRPSHDHVLASLSILISQMLLLIPRHDTVKEADDKHK